MEEKHRCMSRSPANGQVFCALNAGHAGGHVAPGHAWGERVTITRKAAQALHAVVMGDWTDDLQHAMDELERELKSEEGED